MIRPPLIAVRYHSSSSLELLSVLSPVVITKDNGAPVAGPPGSALTRSISETTPATDSASCGRQALAVSARRYS